MKLTIDRRICERYPGVLLGVAVARGVDNRREDGTIVGRLRAEEARVRRELAGVELAAHPRVAPWREAYRAFGASPKKSPSSIENLLRRALKGEEVRHVNSLVDIYNAISLCHLLPAGGEDLERVEGDVRLTFAGEGEAPVQLLGEAEARPPHPGEVVYRDAAGILCRRWNWKEADRTKLTAETRDALLVLEALPPAGRDDLERALSDLAGRIESCCGAQLTTEILSAERPEIEI